MLLIFVDGIGIAESCLMFSGCHKMGWVVGLLVTMAGPTQADRRAFSPRSYPQLYGHRLTLYRAVGVAIKDLGDPAKMGRYLDFDKALDPPAGKRVARAKGLLRKGAGEFSKQQLVSFRKYGNRMGVAWTRLFERSLCFGGGLNWASLTGPSVRLVAQYKTQSREPVFSFGHQVKGIGEIHEYEAALFQAPRDGARVRWLWTSNKKTYAIKDWGKMRKWVADQVSLVKGKHSNLSGRQLDWEVALHIGRTGPQQLIDQGALKLYKPRAPAGWTGWDGERWSF